MVSLDQRLSQPKHFHGIAHDREHAWDVRSDLTCPEPGIGFIFVALMLLLLLAEVFLRSFRKLGSISFFIQFLKINFIDIFGLLAIFLFDCFQLLTFNFMLPWICCLDICVRLV